MVNVAKAVSARRRARDASVRFYAREKERERVQERYFGSMDAVTKVYAQRDREIAQAEERAERAAAAARSEADAAIRELLELRVPRPEVQERLGCTSADIRRAVEAQAKTRAAGERGSGASDEESPVSQIGVALSAEAGELSADGAELSAESTSASSEELSASVQPTVVSAVA